MIIILQCFIVIQSCNIEYRERNYYLNSGEYFQIQLEQIFKQQNQTFMCHGCSEQIQLKNTLNDVGNKFINTQLFRSISSNDTHIVALTKDQNLILYLWKEELLSIVSSQRIDQQVICMSAIYSINNDILLDCYDESNLYIYSLHNGQFKLLFQSPSISPNSSKIQNYCNQDIIYTLYAQFFPTYTILTLFTENDHFLTNQTTWDYGLNSFVVSNGETGFNFIYLLCNNQIVLQLSVVDNLFQIQAFWYQQAVIVGIQVYRSIKFNSQCDQLIFLQQMKPQFWSFYVCEGKFNGNNDFQLDIIIDSFSKYNLFFNDDFFILQQNSSIFISSIKTPQYIFIEKQIEISFDHFFNYNSLYLFNPITNQLFEFGEIIQVYEVNYPQITVQLIDNTTQSIIIQTNDIFPNPKEQCKIKLYFFVIEQSDTNIYLSYKLKYLNQFKLLNTTFYSVITGIQAPLLQIKSFFSDEIGQFSDLTFKQSNFQFDLDSYYISKIQYFELLPKQHCFTVVGAQQLQITVSLCCFDNGCLQFFKSLNKDDPEIQSIQIIQNLNNQLFTALDQGTQNSLLMMTAIQQGIYLINQSTWNITLPTFYSYQLSFNCIIIITLAQEIELISYTGEQLFILTEENIKIYYKNVKSFSPQQILINSQFLSSILLINNVKQIFIFLITKYIQLLPISIITFDFDVEQILQINYKLIIIYYCEGRLYFCLQIWNIEDLFNPKLEKQLRQLRVNNVRSIYSDNLFLYIQQESNQIIAYNPFQSSHMSPWMSFNLNQQYFSSCYVEGFSFVINNNQIYELYPYTLMKFNPNISFQQVDYLQQYYYYFLINSKYNLTNFYQTNNITLNLISTYTNIMLQDITQNIDQRGLNIINLHQVNNNSQIYYYDLINMNEKSNDTECFCTLQNSIAFNQNISYNNSYFLIVTVDNQFILQNNFEAQLVGGMTLKYYSPEYLNCQASISYYNSFYTWCAGIKNSTLLTFILLDSTIYQTNRHVLPYFSSTSQIKYIFNVLFMKTFDLNVNENIFFINILGPENQNFITDCNKCDSFAITNFMNYTETGMIALFYTCKNQFRYLIGIYNFTSKLINFNSKSKILEISSLYEQRIDLGMEVQILKVVDYEITLFIATTNFCSVILAILFSELKQEFIVQQYLSTIPPLGNYILLNSIVTNNTLMLQYFNILDDVQQVIYAFYQLTNLSQVNLYQPFIMIGALTYDKIQTIGITSVENNSFPQILAFKNNSGSIYNLSTYQIKCKTNIGMFTKQQQFQFKIVGYNSFQSNFSILTLNYERPTEISSYFLATIILLCFIIFFVVYLKKHPNRTSQNLLDHQEFEL